RCASRPWPTRYSGMHGCYQGQVTSQHEPHPMSPTVGLIALVVVTMIWGTTFVIIKEALDTISVPLLLAMRLTLAGLLLAWAGWDKRALVPALILGLLSFAGFETQTIGLSITSASN